MRYGVFTHSNPKADPPDYHKSRHYVETLVSKGLADWLDKRNVQMRPSEEYRTDARNYVTAGTMRDAWQIRESAGFLVWQLRSEKCLA